MSGRYLEDFAVGQTFGSGRLRVDRSRSRLSPPNSIRSHSISTKTRRRTQSLAGWRQAAGIQRLSPCGFWSRARSSLQAASWAQDSMSSVAAARAAWGRAHIESEVLEVRPWKLKLTPTSRYILSRLLSEGISKR